MAYCIPSLQISPMFLFDFYHQKPHLLLFTCKKQCNLILATKYFQDIGASGDRALTKVTARYRTEKIDGDNQNAS